MEPNGHIGILPIFFPLMERFPQYKGKIVLESSLETGPLYGGFLYWFGRMLHALR